MNRKTVIMLLVVLAIGAFAIIPSIKDNQRDAEAILLTAKQENKAVMLQLSSVTCSICKQMQPWMSDIVEQHGDKVAIEIFDIEARTDLANRFNATAVPTQVFFDASGNEFYRHVGYLSKGEIMEIFRKGGVSL